MTVNFPTPEQRPTIEEEVRKYRRVKAAATLREKKAMRSGPRKKKAKTPLDRPCEAENCGAFCKGKAYARDPYMRDVEDRAVWVCYNAYQRGYRKLCRLIAKPYDTRHVNGRLRQQRHANRRRTW